MKKSSHSCMLSALLMLSLAAGGGSEHKSGGTASNDDKTNPPPVETQEETTPQETAALAESSEYAELTDFYMAHENPYSSKLDFRFSVQNTSDQGIATLNVFVLEFDENGFPVSVDPYDTYCINGRRTGGMVNLTLGQSGDYVDNLFLSGSTTQVKVVICNIQFQDGTEWQNPYIYEWDYH